jgi:hypothetical protein
MCIYRVITKYVSDYIDLCVCVCNSNRISFVTKLYRMVSSEQRKWANKKSVRVAACYNAVANKWVISPPTMLWTCPLLSNVKYCNFSILS